MSVKYIIIVYRHILDTNYGNGYIHVYSWRNIHTILSRCIVWMLWYVCARFSCFRWQYLVKDALKLITLLILYILNCMIAFMVTNTCISAKYFWNHCSSFTAQCHLFPPPMDCPPQGHRDHTPLSNWTRSDSMQRGIFSFS